MKTIIRGLRHDLKHKLKMIGTTAPTHWRKSQAAWDARELKICRELELAISILTTAQAMLKAFKK